MINTLIAKTGLITGLARDEIILGIGLAVYTVIYLALNKFEATKKYAKYIWLVGLIDIVIYKLLCNTCTKVQPIQFVANPPKKPITKNIVNKNKKVPVKQVVKKQVSNTKSQVNLVSKPDKNDEPKKQEDNTKSVVNADSNQEKQTELENNNVTNKTNNEANNEIDLEEIQFPIYRTENINVESNKVMN